MLRTVKIVRDTANMATERIPRGPTAVTVSANVARLMKDRGTTTQQLSDRLEAIGRPVLPTGITKIIKGGRRVDVDDLMALAIALDVSPLTLLLPHEDMGRRQEVTGASALGGILWEWGRCYHPLVTREDDGTAAAEFQIRAVPEGYRRLQDIARQTMEAHEMWKAANSGEHQ